MKCLPPIPTLFDASLTPTPELFDAARYPNLRRVAHDRALGRIELISVDETSDGFLIGWATIGSGEDAFERSIFLGTAGDFR